MADFAADRFLRGVPSQVSLVAHRVEASPVAGRRPGASRLLRLCLLPSRPAAIPATGWSHRRGVPHRVSHAIG